MKRQPSRRLFARRKRLSWLERSLHDCLLPTYWILFKRGRSLD